MAVVPDHGDICFIAIVSHGHTRWGVVVTVNKARHAGLPFRGISNVSALTYIALSTLENRKLVVSLGGKGYWYIILALLYCIFKIVFLNIFMDFTWLKFCIYGLKPYPINQSINHAFFFENSYRKHDTLYVLIKECEFYSIDRCFRFSYM